MRGSLAADGTFSLAAVEPSLQVLREAVPWRGDGAGVGPVLAGIWVEEEEEYEGEEREKEEREKGEEKDEEEEEGECLYLYHSGEICIVTATSLVQKRWKMI